MAKDTKVSWILSVAYRYKVTPRIFVYISFAGCIWVQSHSAFAQCSTRVASGLLDETVLIQDLANLSSNKMNGRKTGTAGSVLAQHFLQNRFQQIGLSSFPDYPQYRHKFTYPNASSKHRGVNLLAWLQGNELQDQYIIVTAHYDHLGQKGRQVFLGADDNASGVATLLAIAQKLAGTNRRHSFIFLATDAEEKGLYGAKAIVRELPVPHDAVKLNINLDMMAEGGRKSRIYATYSRSETYLKQSVKQVADIASVCFIDGHRKSQRFSRAGDRINWRKASDHAAFAKVGIPYVFIGGGVHNRYQSPNDSFENVDQNFFIRAAETAWLMVQAVDHYH